MSDSNTAENHRHLCAKCGKVFDCSDPKDAEFEHSVCSDCKAEEEQPKPSKRKKTRK